MTMKNILIIMVLTFILLSCKTKGDEKAKDSFKTTEKVFAGTVDLFADNNNPIKVRFSDGDFLNVLGNFYTDLEIDSIQVSKKEFTAKYYYCGKSRINLKVFEKLKNKDANTFRDLEEIKTAHNIIVGNDTIYISGKNNISCFEKGDSVYVTADLG